MKNIFFKSFIAAVIASFCVAIGSASYAQVLGTASLNVERRGHTATQIQGGKILVVGGENTGGVVNQAEVFDTATQTFLVVGTSSGRTDHTATLLPDGRVLIAGGRDSASALNSTEVFNPADNSFSAGPVMKSARAGHTATTLADGRILIVGGDAVGSSEIYDPSAQLFTAGPSMAEPRALHGAALLKSGKVLIAGGTDPNDGTVLDSAETYDPAAGAFTSTTTTMSNARGLPTLKVLPDGKVQVIGGDDQLSMEMFDPNAESFIAMVHLPPTVDLIAATLATQSRAALISTAIQQNPIQGSLTAEELALLDRADQTVTELADKALVAGGVNSQGEVLSSSVLVQSSQATVTTEKFDYIPGEIVKITGTGWQPNEPVSMIVHEEPEAHADSTLSSTADNQGNFVNQDFSPAPADLGRSFSLTAVGQSSGRAAQTAFTDANPSGDMDQCANGPAAAPVACTQANGAWVNGNVNNTKGHYVEGNSVPYRARFTNLVAGHSYTITLGFDITQGGKHAIDYLTSFNRTELTADPCTGNPDGVPCGSTTTIAIPTDTAHVTSQGVPQAAGNFTLYNGTLTGTSPYTFSGTFTTNSSNKVSVTFTATGSAAILAWGGHIASQFDWGTGNSAVNISGSPYHMRFEDSIADNTNHTEFNIGHTDHALAASAVVVGGNIVINKTAVGGDGTFNYTTTGAGLSNFGITTTSGSGSQSFSGLTPGSAGGSRSITETAPTGFALTALSCSVTDVSPLNDTTFTTNLATGVATVSNIGPGDTVTCTYTNSKSGSVTVKKVMVGGTGSFTFTGTPAGTISTNNGTITQTVGAGTYTSTETVPAGWTLTSIVCDDANSTGNTGTHAATFVVAAGENVTCTFTNTKSSSITIKKVMVGGTGSFTFTGSPSGTISTNNGTITQTVAAGTFTATETVPSGWVLTSIVCDDNDSTGSTGTATATFIVAAGENVTCTFTNTKNGSVTVKKVMQGGTGTFTFTGTPNGTISTNNGTITASVAPGTYTSAETVPSGWTLTSIVCDDNDSTGSTGNATATFIVAAGENVTCTFTNAKSGSVTIKKVMQGGTGTFTFTGTPNGTISTNNGTITATVVPGTYTAAETVPSGWALTSIVCDDTDSTGNTGNATATFIVAAGENVTCTFTNTQNGSVTIKKVMVGGTGTFTFTGSPSGTISTNNGTITQSVQPGTFTATETVPTGWALTSIVCDDNDSTGNTGNATATFIVAAGENVTCTFTNTQNGSVTIKKVMVGGTGTFTFTGSPSGTISTNNGTITQSVQPGTFTATETVPTGWALTSIVCDDNDSTGSTGNATATFIVAAGENVTCTFTNTKNGTVTIKKVMQGGTGTFTFTGTPSGTISTNNGTISASVAPGTFTATESVPTGWALTSIVCDDNDSTGDTGTATATFIVAAGENVTCTFTNTKNGTVTIKKVMQGGTGTFTFTGSPSGTISTNNGTISASVAPGTFTATETVPSGWALTSIVCDDNDSTGNTGTATATFIVAAGENVTCTFTNTKSGSITIKKVIQGGTGTFTFTGSPSGTISTNNGTITQSVQPGTFTATETVPSGWALTSIVCDDNDSTGSTGTATATFIVAAGENVTCTFTNTQNGSITIKKVIVGGTGTFTFTGSPSGTISTNNGTLSQSVQPGTFTATETVPSGWTLTSVVCDDNDSTGSTGSASATFIVAAGENVTCTFTNTKKLDATVNTTIHNAAHSPVIAVIVGSIVHDSATVTGSGATPTGTVTFSFFSNGSCSGTPSATSGTFTLTSGAVDGTTFTQTPNSIGSVSFQASYSGDSVYNPSTGACEPLSVAPAAVDTSISTVLSGGGQTGTLILVPTNTPVTDQAALSGNTGNAGGTVTYSVFSDSSCTSLVTSSTKTVTNGVVPASDPVSFSQTGTFFWQAAYSGDAGNNPSTSACTDEQTTVFRIIVKLTPTRDSFLKSEDPNTNEGKNNRLRLAAINGSNIFALAPKKSKKTKTTTTTIAALASGTDRPVAAFNVSGLNVTGLIKAQLVFNIATNNGGWGGGQAVEVRRILSNWSEGSGKNPDLSNGTTVRGSGSGVTWNCPIDTNINNTTQTCASNWGGGNLAPATAAPVIHTDSSSGDMVWDVTTDVLGGEAAITNGWIVKKVDENQTGGEVLYYSREGAAAINALNAAPRLILYYQ